MGTSEPKGQTGPDPQGQPEKAERSDVPYWAVTRNALRVSDVPAQAASLNVEGKRVAGALQGFGQLWQKTYKVHLTGAETTPREVVRVWKEKFPSFHPPQSCFYPSLSGVAPGEIMLINASLQNMPVYTGVMVLYADEESFTVMTAEGLPEAGWNTFSSYRDERVGSKVQSTITPEIRFRALLAGVEPEVRIERT